MATADPNPNEDGPSRYKKIMKADILSRLPRENGDVSSAESYYSAQPVVEQAPQPAESRRPWWNSGFFPIFWTIASALSLAVNVVLCLLVLALLYMREPIQKTVTGQSTGVLGGLYDNFVKMDKATIRTNVKVDTSIPLDIQIPVQTQTTIYLSQDTRIQSPRVLIRTGGLTLDAPAVVTLPKGQPLLIDLNFMVPVRNSVPIHLDVPVNIPLDKTELHQPFVGLQDVVKPWYCMFLPRTDALYIKTCANTASPISIESFIP